ncbi:antitoxin MazE [Macrococcoides goetzii]|nr:antitoxin MazE [Macrococcus goetzii]TDM38988.1 antitoxin MazE [Macrococcus goetzii]TDM41059.1 antitoxin MazE [Macrococcus goetzii]TDM46713.1 antitoxin MazE [Macrococcus goetzii]
MSKLQEQQLIEGYQSMAEINLLIASEHYLLECEVYDNVDYMSAQTDGE